MFYPPIKREIYIYMWVYTKRFCELNIGTIKLILFGESLQYFNKKFQCLKVLDIKLYDKSCDLWI